MLVFWKSSFEHLNSSQIFWVNGIGVEQLNSRATMYSCHLLSPPPVDPVRTSWGVPSFGTNLLLPTPLTLKMVSLREVLSHEVIWPADTHRAHGEGISSEPMLLVFVLLSEALTSECTMDLLLRIRCLGWNDTSLLVFISVVVSSFIHKDVYIYVYSLCAFLPPPWQGVGGTRALAHLLPYK